MKIVINKLLNIKILKFSLFIFCFAFYLNSSAQFYNGLQIDFGKNRLQFDDFFWTFYRYEKFDVYFYLGGKSLANITSNYSFTQINQIQKKFDYELDEKMQFIIYNKLSDFKQSNIGYISNESYNTGGLTRISGNKVFLYYNGNIVDFQKQIRAGIASVIFNQMMFGTSITSQIKNNTIFTIPSWYNEGLISYISEDWNTDIDNIVRDGIISGKYKKFNSLIGNDAIYAGHSFWNFIAEKFGENKISDIVYMTRVSRNIENGFLYVLGRNFSDIIKEWLTFYQDKYFDTNLAEIPQKGMVLKKLKTAKVYHHLKINPDGKHIAYVTNESGQNKVWIYDLERKKSKKIMKSGYKLDEKVDYSYPIITWHPSGEMLAIITEIKGQNYLILYNLKEKKTEKILLQYFSRILDFSYSVNGQLIVLSAVQNGQNDIFVYNMASRSSEQITKDVFDDTHPRFLKGSRQIIFSSNRDNDTIKIDENNLQKINSQIDLYIYDYANRQKILRRVTKTPYADEIFPMEYDNNNICFISNENGINNRYIASFDSVINYIDTAVHYRYITRYYPITNYPMNIIEQDINIPSHTQSEIIFSDGVYKMFVNSLIPEKNLAKLKLLNSPYKSLVLNKLKENLMIDTLKTIVIKPSAKKKLRNLYYEDLKKEDENESVIRQGIIKIKSEKTESDELPFYTEKQRNYDVEYSPNEFTTQIDFSFLNANYQQFSGGGSPIYLNPGFNFLFKIGMSDLMEDYRITGGVRFSFSFDNFEYLLSYENLKHRLDRQIIFHRQSMDNYTFLYDSRQYTHSIYYILRWPFNTVMSVKGTVFLRNDKEVFLSTRDMSNLKKQDIVTNWTGLKGEYIFDNTRILGLNLFTGTRYKFWGEYYQSITGEDKNLFVVGFDYRNYQKIHKTLIWANRFASSTSFGKNKLIYYMGGVDNWLFPKFNTDINIANDQNYSYQTLATNMRGFTQNIRNGNSFAVINSELRFPVFKYFSNKPIKSDFFNNFQLIGFADAGTAWTGTNPWDKNNSLFIKNIYGNPISIKLEKEIDPIVGGVGFGLRSRLLGYFMRADWAWGIESGVIQPYVFYFSLNLDF